jgi:hypothetical protein
VSDVPIREYLETLFRSLRDLIDERDKRYEERDQANKATVNAAMRAAQDAADKIEKAFLAYKEVSNEWRGTLNDIVGRMATRIEVERQFGEMQCKISELRESRSAQTGQNAALEYIASSRRWLWAQALGMATIIVVILIHVL